MKPLNIAILGYNVKQTIAGLRQITENNIEQVITINKTTHTVLLKDGTKLQAILSLDERSLQGKHFDQLMLFDDNRWDIRDHRLKDIFYITNVGMRQSVIPEEFQIIEYEDIIWDMGRNWKVF